MISNLIRNVIVLGSVGSAALLWCGPEVQKRWAAALPGATASESAPPTLATAAPAPAADTSGGRFLTWAVFVLLLPIFTAPLAGAVLEMGSNRGNLCLLLGYTALDALGAVLWCGVPVGGLLSGVLLLLALLVLLAYNVLVCAFLVTLRERVAARPSRGGGKVP